MGAPGRVPPYIRHRFRPLTAGDWRSFPARVRAGQHRACASHAAGRGVFVNFGIFVDPRVMMEMIGQKSMGDNRLHLEMQAQTPSIERKRSIALPVR